MILIDNVISKLYCKSCISSCGSLTYPQLASYFFLFFWHWWDNVYTYLTTDYVIEEITKAGFVEPTPIQGWSMAPRGRDLIGIAEIEGNFSDSP